MKKSDMIDHFERLIRCHTNLDGIGRHISDTQARERAFDAKLAAERCVAEIKKDLKK